MVVERKDRWDGCMVDEAGGAAGKIGEGVAGHPVAIAKLGEIGVGAGNDGIRDSCRRARRHRNSGNYRVQTPTSGVVECDCGRHQQPIGVRAVLRRIAGTHLVVPALPGQRVMVSRIPATRCRLSRVFNEVVADETGQSTVEFAIVTAGFMAVTAVLSLMRHVFGDGVVVEHALAVASHHIQLVAPATMVDVFLY